MKARSAQNKRNRAKNAGRSNGCGRKGSVVRLLERERMGKPPSMAAVLLETNQKKDEKGNPTGEYYNPPLQEALDEYQVSHKVVRPNQVPAEVRMDWDMYLGTQPVVERKKNGRVLGLGTCKQVRDIMDVYTNPFMPNVEVQAQLDEMRRQQEQDMAARVQAEAEALHRLE